MWRGSTTACSMKTVGSPKAPSASRMQVSMASRRSARSSTRRMPRPPPPATAFTKSGAVICSAAATQLVDVGRRRHGLQHRHAGGLGRGDRAGLVAGQGQHLGAGPDEGDAGCGAGLGERRVLREEAVAGVDRVGAAPHGDLRRSPRGRGRPGPGGLPPRSGRPPRPSSGARTSGPRGGRRPPCARRSRARHGRPGLRSRHGWRRAPWRTWAERYRVTGVSWVTCPHLGRGRPARVPSVRPPAAPGRATTRRSPRGPRPCGVGESPRRCSLALESMTNGLANM